MVEASYDEAGGELAASRLLRASPRPTALFVANIRAAIGALAAARRIGVSVPDDVSLVGFHDAPVAMYLDPELTTVKMPLREMGSAAIESLLALLEGRAVEDVRVARHPSSSCVARLRHHVDWAQAAQYGRRGKRLPARAREVVAIGQLDGKVAIVTGAGTGLGRGIAEELARAGAGIAVLEIDAESGEQAAGELAALGVEARSYPTDVADSAQVDAAFAATVRDFGRLDIVVNNAGISRVGPHTQDVTDEDWHDSIAVMQSGVFYCMRAAGRILVPQASGSVINISSIRGFSPNPGRMTYSVPRQP